MTVFQHSLEQTFFYSVVCTNVRLSEFSQAKPYKNDPEILAMTNLVRYVFHTSRAWSANHCSIFMSIILRITLHNTTDIWNNQTISQLNTFTSASPPCRLNGYCHKVEILFAVSLGLQFQSQLRYLSAGCGREYPMLGT